MKHLRTLAAAAIAVALTACGGAEEAVVTDDAKPDEAPALKADKGVDVDAKVIKIGMLNDESGPAAAIGKPFANGKRLLAAAINAGDSGLLPEGWKVELVEKDHAYNPQQSVQAFNTIKDDVLFIGTSFGTPNTLPLRPHLAKENLVAFPASLSSEMAANTHTPPLGPSYEIEARRAMDFVVEQAGGADKVKAGIVYQQDDYGKDGHKGWTEAAKAYGVELVSEQTVSPGQKDFAAVVTGLKGAGATHVLLTTLPSATGPIVGTAAQLKYMPVYVGNTPAWIDAFFVPEVIPSVVFTNYHQVNGLPYWGEKVPGMDAFTKTWEAHGKEMGNPDFYILLSYVQGLVQIEAAKRAIEQGDITRAGYLKAMQSIDKWDNAGMLQPVSLNGKPYVVGTRTRVLKPDFEKKSWTEAAGWSEPKGPSTQAAAPAEGDEAVKAKAPAH